MGLPNPSRIKDVLETNSSRPQRKASALVGVEPTEQTRCSVFGCIKLTMMLKGAA